MTNHKIVLLSLLILTPIHSVCDQWNTAKAAAAACVVGVGARAATNLMSSALATNGRIIDWEGPEHLLNMQGTYEGTEANPEHMSEKEGVHWETYRTLGLSASIIAANTTFKAIKNGTPSVGITGKAAALVVAPIVITGAVHILSTMLRKSDWFYDRNIVDKARRITAEKLELCHYYLRKACLPIILATQHIK